jgi:hypothetical protein
MNFSTNSNLLYFVVMQRTTKDEGKENQTTESSIVPLEDEAPAVSMSFPPRLAHQFTLVYMICTSILSISFSS